MNDPAIAAIMLVPRARPRWLGGKASVKIAVELAMMNAAPTPWKIRMTIMKMAASGPCIQVIDSMIEKKVKMTKPMLYMRVRPNMSPSRPKLTTSTAVITM